MAKENQNRDRKQEKKNSKNKSISLLEELKEETVHGVLAIVCFVLALSFLLARFGKGGPAGNGIYSFFDALLGFGYFLLPLTLIMLGVSFWNTLERKLPLSKLLGGILFLIGGLGLLSLISETSGGRIGDIIATPLIRLFDLYITGTFLVAILFISIFIIFDTRVSFSHLNAFLIKIFTKKEKSAEILILKDEEPLQENLAKKEEGKGQEDAPMPKKEVRRKEGSDENMAMVSAFSSTHTPFVAPPLSLLETDKGKPGVGDIKANANIIKRTLQNFGIDVEMDEISIGPSVTRYALKPAEGVKLSKIIGLQNNLSLALAAHPIRIEAPIPGKSLVGIEIPNNIKTTVGLGTLLAQEEYQSSTKPLLVSLGKGISGKSHFANLAKMPHLLIAGATGSGKSVTIHALITSLLFRNSPENLRFIMIDPKRVELTLYNKIPHLLTPVITEAKKAILALKWAAKEMDRRYNILESESVRDIESYHKNIVEPKIKKMEAEKNPVEGALIPETMPYIVVIIDELADIMQSYPRELESAIVRLAQMSRAVGIHLMLSTQRPSVNVITGLIKANVPARIALQVASQIDSRTILDGRGAEELLGAGDMLYLSGEMSGPQRIQSAYITEGEVKKVVNFLIETYRDTIPNEINISGDNQKNSTFDAMNLDEAGGSDDDDLYEEARDIVMKAGKGSTSYIQRKLRVGYARAARLMDLLEERGVIGPADGSKPREVIGFEGQGGAESDEMLDEQL
jgi:S-DNA-T family DNA segregation ATPase FtsK/SpoIIIE